MELSDVVTELKDKFERAKKVSNHQATDTAILTVYCTLTGAQPEELRPYFDELKKVSNHQAEDTALLACCAHYIINHPKE